MDATPKRPLHEEAELALVQTLVFAEWRRHDRDDTAQRHSRQLRGNRIVCYWKSAAQNATLSFFGGVHFSVLLAP